VIVVTAPSSAQRADATPYPSAGRGWFLVIMLTIAYVLSYIDRSILGLLIQPIKADLGLSDKQIGWIIGPAFGVFYATMGLPLGWLVDRSRRTWIVGIGIVVWSLATAASGLVNSFWHLFTARMAVGVGEATLSPSAFSMIGDSFPPEKRGKPIGFYAMALSLGAGIGSLISAFVIPWAKAGGRIESGIFNGFAPWQLTFFMVGFPGLLVAIAFFLMREPERRVAMGHDESLKGNGFRDAIGYIGRHWATYLTFILPVCTMTIIAYSHQFLAPVFERTWGWPAEKYAFINACALILIGPANVIFQGWLSDRWSQSGTKDAPFRLLIIGFLIMVPTAILPFFMPTPELAFAILCVNVIGIGMVSAVNVTSLLLITPAPIRGQVVAMFYVTISMSGLFLGPTTVGKLSTDYFGEDELRLALATVAAIFAVVPALLLPTALRLYRAQVERLGSAAS
jgi:MFS family permease